MKQIQLNKQTILQMEQNDMEATTGGLRICLISCTNGSRKGKKCCDSLIVPMNIDSNGI